MPIAAVWEVVSSFERPLGGATRAPPVRWRQALAWEGGFARRSMEPLRYKVQVTVGLVLLSWLCGVNVYQVSPGEFLRERGQGAWIDRGIHVNL